MVWLFIKAKDWIYSMFRKILYLVRTSKIINAIFQHWENTSNEQYTNIMPRFQNKSLLAVQNQINVIGLETLRIHINLFVEKV